MKQLLPLLAVSMLACSQANAQVVIPFDFSNGNEVLLQLQGTAAVRATGGVDDSGYLSITDAANSQRGEAILPLGSFVGGDQLVTAFRIEADLRVGGGTDRPADGFSFSLVRPTDPFLVDGTYAGTVGEPSPPGLPEEGTVTGVSVGFDEWTSGALGNQGPGGADAGDDVVGFSIRVDEVIVDQVALPTLNGAVGDITSLQTGPNGGGLDALAWEPLVIDFNEDNVLSILWKNNLVYSDTLETAPYQGDLVFGGRTGGANAAHHIDNVTVTFDTCTSLDGVNCVPEPGSITLLGISGLMLGLLRRRRR